MGCYVHIHVCFPFNICNEKKLLKEIALESLLEIINRLKCSDHEKTDVKRFLSYIIENSGLISGPKGSLVLWGYTGNYTNVLEFANDLQGFWQNLYRSNGLGAHERIIIFHEIEQSEKASVIEIKLSNTYDKNSNLIFTEYKDLPFAWMQF